MSCRFFWQNLWDDYSLTETSEHLNFAAENTQHRDFNTAWRSNYEAGSGWGNFKIVLNDNDDIVFRETAIEGWRTATLDAGEYDVDGICAQIKAKMDAAGGGAVYTATYFEITNKFTIASDGGGAGPTFQMSNAGNSAFTTLGFTIGPWTGALTYTATVARIHSEERITVDFTAATNIYAVMIRGHNFSTSASVKAEFSTDNFATVGSTTSFTIQDDILVLEWATPKNYQYARIWIEDRENSDLCVKMGRVFFGTHFQPTRSFLEQAAHTPVDPSILSSSENGQLSSIQLDHYFTKTYSFIMESADKANFDTMFTSRGTSKDLFFTEDTSSYLATTDYVKFDRWQFTSILHSSPVWRLDVGVAKLR